MTGNETWCYGYDPETKQASSQWKTPNSQKSKKAQQVRSKVKIILISFFYANETVHKEFFPPGQSVSQQFYLEVLWNYAILCGKNDHKCGAVVIGSFTTTMPLPTRP